MPAARAYVSAASTAARWTARSTSTRRPAEASTGRASKVAAASGRRAAETTAAAVARRRPTVGRRLAAIVAAPAAPAKVGTSIRWGLALMHDRRRYLQRPAAARRGVRVMISVSSLTAAGVSPEPALLVTRARLALLAIAESRAGRRLRLRPAEPVPSVIRPASNGWRALLRRRVDATRRPEAAPVCTWIAGSTAAGRAYHRLVARPAKSLSAPLGSSIDSRIIPIGRSAETSPTSALPRTISIAVRLRLRERTGRTLSQPRIRPGAFRSPCRCNA